MNIIDRLKSSCYSLDDDLWYVILGAIAGYLALVCLLIVGLLL
jgi:hypothetical protein